MNDRTTTMKRVLVTGGGGYIGANVVRVLLKQGYRVRVLDNFTYGSQGLADLENDPRVEIQVGDICDPHAVRNALQGIDGVAHMASLVGQPACNLDPARTYAINTEATRTLVQLAEEAGVSRFVFASTCSVYGLQDGEMTENSPPSTAGDPYAESKRRGEEIVLAAAKLSPRIVRLSTVYGLAPRMRFDLVVNVLSALAVRKKEFTVSGGNAWRPFVHVWDVARAVVAVLEADDALADREIFNVGDSRDNRTINHVAALIRREEPDVTVHWDLTNPDGRSYFVSFDKIRAVLGFEHSVELHQGVRDIVEFVRRRNDVEPTAPIFSNIGWLQHLAEQRTEKAQVA